MSFTICIRYVHDHTTILAIIVLLLYHISFGFGWQATPWLYPIELNGQGTRTKAVALSTATNWLMSFIVVEVTPVSIESETFGWAFFIIWTVLNCVFGVAVAAFYFDIKGEVLEGIDLYDWDDYSVMGWGRKPHIRMRARASEQSGYSCTGCDGVNLLAEGVRKHSVHKLMTKGAEVRDMAAVEAKGLPAIMEGYVMGDNNGSGSGSGQRDTPSSEVDPLDTSRGGEGV